MKIDYRREMKHNYLIIDPEALTWCNYECRMLEGNRIEGILHFQLRQIDDGVRFYYEITSKQPLSRVLENRNIGAEEIRRLVIGISGALNRIEQYLLPEGSVLLEQEYLYVEPESFRIWLCLVPGLNRNFPEDYGRLLEYLLGKVDHQDKDAVVLAYGLYQETRKDNYGMDNILQLLCRDKETSGRENSAENFCPVELRGGGGVGQRETERQGDEKRSVRKRDGQKYRAEGRHAQAMDRKNRHIMKESGKNSLWIGFCRLINSILPSKEEAAVNQASWELLFQDEEETRQDRGNHSAPVEQDTILLTDLKAEEREPRRLRAMEEGMEDIIICYYPFVIGKQQNLTDYVLARHTVSRLHLRIDCEGDRYYIQDLNSTNGTMVRGCLLENNQSTDIQIGDEVQIAEYRYRFE